MMRRVMLLAQSSAAAIMWPAVAMADTSQCAGLSQLQGSAGGANCTDTSSLQNHLGSIFDTIFIVATVAAVIVIVVAALGFVFSSGDPKRAGQAKNTIVGAIVGLFVVVAARALVAFIIGRLT